MIGVFLLVVTVCSTAVFAADLDKVSRQVARLNLERSGYVLGAALNPDQQKIALANPLEASVPGTYKFRDHNLFIVAQEDTHRVIVIYERFEDASKQKAQDLIGDLYVSFEEPTVSAHEKVVYWAWSKKGKISSKAFDTAKDEKKILDILATVKCISDIKIMGEPKADEPVRGLVYYIISSDPMLQFFKDKQNTFTSAEKK